MKQRYTYYRCVRCHEAIREERLEAKILAKLGPVDVDTGISKAARIHAAAAEYLFRGGDIEVRGHTPSSNIQTTSAEARGIEIAQIAND